MTKDKALVDENGVVRYRLENGATLLIKEDTSSSVVSLNIWIEAGSIDERPDERGMAHLIEHMIFKGTNKRGVGEISRQVEAAGGYLNAFTSFEHTCFYVVLPSSQIQKALEVEFDAYLHSTFDAKELEKEKEVVFEEMRMRHDDPWSWSWELLFNTLYHKNPYHWPVIGDMAILKKIPREKLLKYYKTHYVPENTVVTVVGNISSQKIISWIQKNVELFSTPKPPHRKFNDDFEPKALSLRTEAGDVQQIYLSLGYPTIPLSHPDTPALEILDSILGEGVASRLNLKIREESQVADEVGTEIFSGKYGGSFVFQSLTDTKRVEKCLAEMMWELKKLILTGVDDLELTKVKNKIRASKIYEKQSVDGQAKTLGFWELQGDYQIESKFLKALDAVSSKDVQKVAEKYLKPHRASLIIYHPKNEKVTTTPSYWQSILEKGFNRELTKSVIKPAKEKIKKLKLKNGSVLWIKERKGLPLVSLGVFLKGGFVNEEAAQYGITSLMAKCLLKGTRLKNNEVLSKEIEGLAAHLDPQMEKDYWGLTLDTITGNFEKSFDLLLEVLLEPSFLNSEVNKEKQLQIASIERLKDDPAEHALLQSDVLTFAGTAYAHMPLGSIKTVAKISAHDIQKWHFKHISSKNMIWVAVGDFKSEDLKKIIDFKIPEINSKKFNNNKKLKSTTLKQNNLRLKTEGQQSNLVLGFKAPVFGSEEYLAFRVLTTILNGMGGRLFVELREKRSLAYSVFATHDAGAEAGIYQVYIGCAPQKNEQAKKELLKVLESFSKTKISFEEINRAKTYMIGLYQVGQQSNRSQLLSYARQELLGKGAPWVEKFPDLIRQVTSAEIQKVAKKYLETDNKTWVVLSPESQD